jgi:hypothetical protein
MGWCKGRKSGRVAKRDEAPPLLFRIATRCEPDIGWFLLASDGYEYEPVKGDTLASTGWNLIQKDPTATVSREKDFVNSVEVSDAIKEVPFMECCR